MNMGDDHSEETQQIPCENGKPLHLQSNNHVTPVSSQTEDGRGNTNSLPQGSADLGYDSASNGVASSKQSSDTRSENRAKSERQASVSKANGNNHKSSSIPPQIQTSTEVASQVEENLVSEAASSTTDSVIRSPSPTRTESTETQPASASSQTKKKTSQNQDRSKLRKGKWTIEEEEYTSRIIHHFSTGLLTLPEGTTLRSYLAEKLNCDPMRITKKYAGAACLGKRVYHLCDRSQATVADVEMAKAELARLELRFRARVEHGQTGIPIPRTDVMPTIGNGPSNIFAPNPQTAAAAANQWLQSFAGMASPAANPSTVSSFPMPVAPAQIPPSTTAAAPTTTNGVSSGTWQIPHGPQGSQQWLAPNPTTPSPSPIVPNIQQNPTSSMQAANDAMAKIAWAQAAASLTPALSQLAAANLQKQQQQLQQAYQAQMQQGLTSGVPNTTTAMGLVPRVPGNGLSSAPVALNHTIANRPPLPPQTSQTVALLETKPGKFDGDKKEDNPKPSSSENEASNPRSKEDEAAGSMLMGFLSSLRKSFLDAVEQKDRSANGVGALTDKAILPEATQTAARDTSSKAIAQPKHTKRAKKVRETSSIGSSTDVGSGLLSRRAGLTDYRFSARTETSSGGTSHPGDSSMEETESSSSDNAVQRSGRSGETRKADPSSSDDSDEQFDDRGFGPPRKRIKNKRVVGEFTSKNIAEHNHRMHAMLGPVTMNKFSQENQIASTTVEKRKSQKRSRNDTD
jgi:hypothetical protein